MKDIARQTFDHLFPSPEELWQRGGAIMLDTVIDEGHIEQVPFFDLEITKVRTLDDEPFITKRGRKLGRSVLHRIDVNGVDHLARAFVPADELRTDHDFTITSGTAWMTTIDGYALDRSRKLVADTHMPLLQVGPPHSSHALPRPLELLRVPRTIREANETSLARTAQTEQLVFAALSSMYDLPRTQVAIGDSRDSNTTAGQYAYMKHYESDIIAFDNKGRCAPEKVNFENLPEFANWLADTTIGGVAVSLCLAKQGQLASLRGSASLNPNFIASSLTGTMRALASGETRRMLDWVPKDARGIDILYGRDDLSHPDIITEAWQGHPNVVVKVVPNGTHASLLHPLAHAGRRKRMVHRAEQFRSNHGDTAAMDWELIHGVVPAPQQSQTLAIKNPPQAV